MKASTIIGIIVVVIIVGLGIYAFDQHNSNSDSTPLPADSADQSANTDTNNSQTITPNPTTTAATLGTASNVTLGNYLTAANGMTLYMYTKDTAGVSNCSGDCAVKWPPYTVASAIGLNGVTGVAGNIGTITRADGTLQVTYNNEPLYFWYQDIKVGDTSGQNVGQVWFVVKP
jgi:predicted lipoprotein with Yx(FWY)xxD motif